jgi:copper(I)-binding protein
MRYGFFVVGLLGLVAGWLVLARGVSSTDIQIVDAWVQETTARQAVLHLMIGSNGVSSDRLVRISTELAKRVMIFNQLGEASKDLVIPADSNWVMGTDVPRIELVELTQSLKAPATFPILFVFERAGKLYSQVRVEVAGAHSPH